MNDLYEAIGTLAAAAHANGDTIDENIRPEDDQNVQHGFDIYHRSNFIRIGQKRDEQRFEVTSPYTFLNVLERNTSQSELAARADVDLSSLSPDDRRRKIQTILQDELEEASTQYEDFAEAISREIAPTDYEFIKLTYGESNLWNGFLVRDYIYPTEESFSITEYRKAVSDIRSVRIEATQLAHEVVDILDPADSEPLSEDPESESRTNQRPPSPGFQ